MKTIYFIISVVILVACIQEETCDEVLASNNHVEFKNFEFDHINLISHDQRAIVNKNNVEILLISSFAGRLDDALISGDIITKNKNENIVIVKRKNEILRFEMLCKDDIAEFKIDTLSQ